MFLPVKIHHIKINALIDTGSTFNIISKDLYNSIPNYHKSGFQHLENDTVLLANNQTISITGTACIKMCVEGAIHNIPVHILPHTSHPLILGIQYLRDKGVVLNLSDRTCTFGTTTVKCSRRTVIPANTEVVIWGILPKDVLYGSQGVCSSSRYCLNQQLLVAKTLVTVSYDNMVPIKILNPTSTAKTILSGKSIAEFEHTTVDCEAMNISGSSLQNVTGPSNTEKSENSFDAQFNIPAYLSPEDQSKLRNLLHRYKSLFVTPDSPDLGYTDVVKHKIILKPNAKPKHQRPYRLPPDKREVLRHQLDELLRQGIISQVDESEEILITSPVVLVSKKARSKPSSPVTKESSLSEFRFCVDFRYLNSQTQTFQYEIPNLQELTESFSDKTPQYFTSIDLSSGFFQMPIDSDSARLTAFNTCYGTYKFQRLPMGLSSAPSTFQLLMDKVLRGLTFKSCLCYLDDILIASSTFSQHLEDLEEVFARLESAGLKLGPRKCSFAQESCIFLGHLISKEGISPPPDRVKAVQDIGIPQNIKALRRILGLFNWFRKFIPNYSVAAQPLVHLTQKGVPFRWTEIHQTALDNLKTLLQNSRVLAFPNFDLTFYLAVDTCAKGIGYMLYQKPNGTSEDFRVIRFGSKSLSKWQRSYGPTKLELLGMVTAILDCATYLRGRKFIVECDHQALRPLFQKQMKGAIYERWIAILQQFNFEICYKPAAQMQVADTLSRSPQPSNDFNSPDEDDPYFPYLKDNTGNIVVPNGHFLHGLLADDSDQQTSSTICTVGADDSEARTKTINVSQEVNNVQMSLPPQLMPRLISTKSLGNTQNQEEVYDADSEEVEEPKIRMRSKKCKSRQKCFRTPVNNTDIKADIPEPSHILENKPCSLTTPSRSCDSSNQSSSKKYISSDALTDKDDDNESYFILQCPFSTNNEDFTAPSVTIESSDQSEHSVAQSTTVGSSDSTEDSGKKGLTSDSVATTTDNTDTLLDQVRAIDLFSKGNFDLDTVKTLQHQDKALHVFIDYLLHGRLPSSQKESRRVLLESSDYLLHDGVLFHSRIPKTKRTKSLQHYQLAIPDVMVRTVIELYHDTPLGGHGGIQHTVDSIRDSYYFPRLATIVAEFVRSCPQCQARKTTRAHTKSGIVAFPTPTRPFDVWEMDLYGPVPVDRHGQSFIFTAVDQFSKYLFAVPIRNKDAITVSEAIYSLITTFGVCKTLISDQGSEFISKCTKEVCRLLDIKQQFTPSFTHHCLGSVERTHRTLAERLTPFIQNGKTWSDVLPSVIFSMNNTVNATLGYSPFEIVFGHRPRFPLSTHVHPTDFDTIPKDYNHYIKMISECLDTIREDVSKHAAIARDAFLKRENSKTNPLHVDAGDYVYLLKDPTGKGQKFQNKYAGPYVIHEVISPHLVHLMDPTSAKLLHRPIHMNRLKLAYVRVPEPTGYFLPEVTRTQAQPNPPDNQLAYLVTTDIDTVSGDDSVYNTETKEDSEPPGPITKESGIQRDSEGDTVCRSSKHSDLHIPSVVQNLFENEPTSPQQLADTTSPHTKQNPVDDRRPQRTKRKPVRFRDDHHVDPNELTSASGSGICKVQRVLARRKHCNDYHYLVHHRGEPAKYATWVSVEKLDPKTRANIQKRPPPLV